MKKFCSVLIIFICFDLFAFAPKLNKSADFIVILDEFYSIETLQIKFENKIQKIEQLSKVLPIYSITFDKTKYSKIEIQNYILSKGIVNSIQENFILTSRSGTTPADPNYNSQWHLKKIQADVAWNFVRSSITKYNDTIVLAILDEGLHLNHPDFKNRFWKNKLEIPNNNIDDDNNGYIDDIYGWNFMGKNNDISDSFLYKGKHGTPIAGIVGASGDDSIGICGINWNVKLMIVNIADTAQVYSTYLSDVIMAYSYILEHRKLYNQTNGAQGAFVTAINNSWGTERKQAIEAPVWCQFINELGKEGILLIGAVTNANENVDTYGDLPTLCSSNFLITVNNSNSIDNHVPSGYSTSSVDISAPGTSIFTTRNYVPINIVNGLYSSSFSGTSFSAPMVTGAIGILYAHACPKFLDTMKANPQKAATLIKRFILEGSDVFPQLTNKTQSGGRLNIYKAMKMMNSYCDGSLTISQPLSHNISVYPNPFLNSFEIVGIESSEIVNVKLFSLTGQEINFELNENHVIINDHISNGIYFLKIETSSQVFVLKIIK